MRNKILPVEYPPITTYPIIANIFAVLWHKKEQVLPWFADHYIQLHATGHEGGAMWFNFYDADFLYKIHPADYCPYLLTQQIDKSSFNRANFCFTNFIEEQINNDYYIITHLNQYFLPCSYHYNVRNSMHPTFIYGYNNDQKIIHMSDFYDDKKYKSKTATFDEINQSYNFDHLETDAPQAFYGITLYKFVKSRYKTNINLLKQTLEDYIEGKDSTRRYFHSVQFQFTNSQTDNSDYGINCYNMLAKHINYCKEKGDWPDVRPFHLLYDHKVAMKIRLNYLVDNNYINNKEKDRLLLLCDKLINSTLAFRNLALKHQVQSDSKTLVALYESCQSIQKFDLEFTTKFMQALK